MSTPNLPVIAPGRRCSDCAYLHTVREKMVGRSVGVSFSCWFGHFRNQYTCDGLEAFRTAETCGQFEEAKDDE